MPISPVVKFLSAACKVGLLELKRRDYCLSGCDQGVLRADREHSCAPRLVCASGRTGIPVRPTWDMWRQLQLVTPAGKIGRLLSSTYFELNKHVWIVSTVRHELIRPGVIGVRIRPWKCRNFN